MKTIIYKVLLILFACTSLTSCIDDDIAECIEVDDIPAMFTDGYSLNMIVTLDEMGGTRAVEYTSDRGKELKALESYIDPEKFRVLFFDREERFLFESKSRWVKKIVPNKENNGYSEWFVAVPIYAYGNDESEDWNWEEIRRVLTGEDMDEAIELYKQGNKKYQELYCEKSVKDAINAENKNQQIPAFKIAVLVNRPNKEWNMGINGRYSSANNNPDTQFPSGRKDGDDIGYYNGDILEKATASITDNGWAIVNGPKWKSEHTRWGTNKKTVFDLHHCQYDPIYDGKSYNDRGGIKYDTNTNPPGVEGVNHVKGIYVGNNNTTYNIYYVNYEVYNFVADKVNFGEGFDGKEGLPTMGATSTWVDWASETGKNSDPNKSSIGNSGYRYFVPPTKDHPIPMYGIQDFYKLKNWVKGTPFNLSKTTEGQEDDYDYRSISLLRSVVKLELVLSFMPDWLMMFYPNIYARCEPMNVWTPTNEIWDNHDTEHEFGDDEGCEWYNIRKYGAVTRINQITNDPNNDSKFTNYNDKDLRDESIARYKKRMSWFYGAWSENGPDGQPRWNLEYLNDPSCVAQKTPINVNGITPPYPQIFNSCVQRVQGAVCYDGVTSPRESKSYGKLYFEEDDGIHFVVYVGERNVNDPSNIMQIGTSGNGGPTICYWQLKTSSQSLSIALAYNEENVSGSAKSYRLNNLTKPDRDMNEYEKAVQNGTAAVPWPLLRNHVYKITVKGGPSAAAMRFGGDGGLSIKSEILYSKSINFNRARSEKKAIEKKMTEEKAIEKK